MDESLLIRGGGGGSKRDTRPLLLKLGFALALSIAGYFASQFNTKPKLPPPNNSSGDDGSKESTPKSSAISARGLRDELHILTTEESLAKIINGTTNISDELSAVDAVEDGFLMQDFGNKVVMSEFETDPDKVAEERVLLELEERKEMEEEIAYLRNLVEVLKERERNLEVQMIEYYGLKEQEASTRELENRLKVSAMESKMLNLKIESLQADNQKLKAQVSDYPKVVCELESARHEIRNLKRRMEVDGEQAKEKLSALHQRITEMLHRERKNEEVDVEVEKKLKRLKELEDEVMDLRMVNSRLAEENLKFVEMLESAKMEDSYESDHTKVQALEEASHLREENEELKKELEQLQTDRCADVEELVYLRWVNACLRYELRNYQPSGGQTVARDLSKCLSPDSEKKAKQLILEYANSGTHERNINFIDFDTESCSSSHTSNEECSDISFAGFSSSTKNSSSKKSKLVSKLKKLVLGKDNKRSKANSAVNSTKTASVSQCSFEDANGRRSSFDSASSCTSAENTPSHPNDQGQSKPAQSQRNHRPSLDVQRLRMLDVEVQESIAQRCMSDLGSSHGHMRMISEDCLSDWSHNNEHEDVDVPEKAKLKKFADVLKGSRGPLKLKRRLVSFSSN